MSRSIPGPFLTHLQQAVNTDAWAIEITRTDAQVFRWTTHDEDKTIDGNVYSSQPGVDLSQWVNTADLAVDNAEATVLPDADITRADLVAGVWDGAAWRVIHFNWADTSQFYVYKRGKFGQFNPRRDSFVAELRDLRQAIQPDTTWIFQPGCRYRLGDSRCTVDLGPFTVTGSVTSAASSRVFTDTTRTEPDNWFREGVLTWTSGANSGRSQKIVAYAANTFTFALPMVNAILNGDAYSVIAGCEKTLAACRDKFNNVLNYGGEPDKPMVDELSAPTPVQA
jgi:uncharacterized phage protein (TIGR02218 family)